jgi:hypothetical protein
METALAMSRRTLLIGPVGAIAFCLFYIDGRARKEGFDIKALMYSLGGRVT